MNEIEYIRYYKKFAKQLYGMGYKLKLGNNSFIIKKRVSYFDFHLECDTLSDVQCAVATLGLAEGIDVTEDEHE